MGVKRLTDDAAAQDQSHGVRVVSAAGIRPEPIDWLWPGWLAAGKLHVLAGARSTGKTTLALSLGATITTSGQWRDGRAAPPTPGSVLIWSGEDDPRDTLIPRLIRNSSTSLMVLTMLTASELSIRPKTRGD